MSLRKVEKNCKTQVWVQIQAPGTAWRNWQVGRGLPPALLLGSQLQAGFSTVNSLFTMLLVVQQGPGELEEQDVVAGVAECLEEGTWLGQVVRVLVETALTCTVSSW